MHRLPLLLLLGCATAPAGANPFDRICDDYWEWQMRSSPEWATSEGDDRWNDRLSDLSDSGRAESRKADVEFLARLDAIPRADLDAPRRLSFDILRRQLTLAIEETDHKFWQWDIDPLGGPQVSFLEQINVHPFRTEKDVRDLVARLRAFPRTLREYIANLRAGMDEGRLAPAAVVARVIAQLEALLATPSEQWALMDAIRRTRDARIEPAEELEFELRAAVKINVRNAYVELHRFLTEEYKSRESVGLGALPGGAAAYRFRVRRHTTTDLTPEQIHQIGLDEMKAIHGEMAAIAKKLGHAGDVKSFIAAMKSDPANFKSSRDDVLTMYRAALAKSEALLPKWFGRLPRYACKVKAIEDYREKDAPTAYYYSADPKHTRDAYFYANTYQPETRPIYSAMALTVHEAVPGHHLQIAIAQEIEGLPKFRRHASSTAFVEGWGLYSERLADEMGLYETDRERFGMLSYQAWRACRLVVDTGLHAMNWPREKAIRFMVDNVADSEANLTNEIDRYITWPGQALAYKIGQRELLALRAEAKERLGARFDIREFHDAVLENGPLPLKVLRTVIEDWIRRRAS